MIGKLLLVFWIVRCLQGIHGDAAAALRWPTPNEEAYDERNDLEIFRAVVQSMREWEAHKKQNRRWKRDVSRVCYEDVGCFEDTGPFGYLEMLPSPPKDVGTRFFVYGSRKARSIPMEVPAEEIADKAFQAIDPELPTKVIVHGFGSSCDHIWVYEMRSALMSVHECNIVCVDWGPGSAVPNYVRAAANTRLVGRQLAKLVRKLGVPLEQVHLIGFSLGAHVAGFAGAELGNVSRITGLDPAGPLFEAQDPRARLDATDAHFVDVIHSNGEQLILGGLGSWHPMGDVDFYPNGGRMQTGCSNLFLGAVSDIIWSSAVEGRSLCNHRRAYKLFTDSVSPRCRFPAFPCDSGYDGLLRGDCFPCGVNGAEKPCGDMGYYSDESPARGQLYLVTRDEEPFCAHQYQLKLYNSRGERPARSYGKLQITLVGKGALNETFTMTRKDDEELLVGSVLHKIIVPHPSIDDLEAIEIKYTAYNGWISSGLVSWSIDKVSIVDSFGKSLSVCQRGLILESGHPIYLPLYPGECNIPPEPETTSTSPGLSQTTMTTPHVDQFAQNKRGGGIGPFTKEQNYEKGSFSAEDVTEQTRPNKKGLGPFTKDQNPQLYEKISFEPQDIFTKAKKMFAAEASSSESSSQTANPWALADITDGDSNSLENSAAESGRGFSESTSLQKTQTSTSLPRTGETSDSTTIGSWSSSSSSSSLLYGDEIREPILKVSGKETGRSMRIQEIREPLLRPRLSRQNAARRRDQQKIETSPETRTGRGFTVQFLPERLAGILAQAERYARQTLLPLISQYTPSFVGGMRFNEPKYFPPLGDIANESLENSNSREIVNSEYGVSSQEMEEYARKELNSTLRVGKKYSTDNKSNDDESMLVESHNEFEPRSSLEIDDSLKDQSSSEVRSSPGMSRITAKSQRNEDENGETHKIPTTTMAVATSSENASTNIDDDWIPIVPSVMEGSSREVENEFETRKFIPLVDFAKVDEYSQSSTSEINVDIDDGFTTDTTDHTETTSPAFVSHIQKIPARTSPRNERTMKSVISTIFPYIYERKNDPRTRYIPLLPEEDVRKSTTLMERDR